MSPPKLLLTYVTYCSLFISIIISYFFIDYFKDNFSYGKYLILYAIVFTTFISLKKYIKNVDIYIIIWTLSLLVHIIYTQRYQTQTDDFNKKFETKNKKFKINATIEEFFTTRQNKNRILIKIHEISEESTVYQFKKDVYGYIIISNIENLNIGDQFIINNAYTLFSKNIKKISYRNYLLSKHIILTSFVHPKQINIIKKNYDPIYIIKKYKNHLKNKLKNNLTPNTYGLSLALILGDKSKITPSLYEQFKKSGVFHFIAISGLHITIISTLLFFILNLFLSPSTSKKVIIFFIIPIYTIMLSFSPPIMRTLIMLLIGLFLIHIGRPVEKNLHLLFPLLFVSFVIHILLLPNDLSSVSLQLSFSATLGIFFSLILIEKINIKNKILLYLINFSIISIGAQIFTLPFILYYFKVINPYAIVYNFIIYPFILIYLILTIIIITLPISTLFIFNKIINYVYWGLTETFKKLLPFFSSHPIEFNFYYMIISILMILLFIYISLKKNLLKYK